MQKNANLIENSLGLGIKNFPITLGHIKFQLN